MHWDSRRNNKRACWWGKGEPYWSHFFSSQRYRLARKGGRFHLGLLFWACHWTPQIAAHPEFDAPLSRNGRAHWFISGRKGREDGETERTLLRLLINAFITFVSPAVPVPWCSGDTQCSPVNHRNAHFWNRYVVQLLFSAPAMSSQQNAAACFSGFKSRWRNKGQRIYVNANDESHPNARSWCTYSAFVHFPLVVVLLQG